jgi:methanogen homoaconitase small subunit
MRPDRDVGEAAFIEARPDFNKGAQPGDLIVAGSNFGCGSSREYAPLALKRRGIAAIIAPSFARIFFRNAINLGIPVFVSQSVPAYVEDGDQGEIDLSTGVLSVSGDRYELQPLPPFAQAIVAAGGVAAYVRNHGRLPTL